METIKEVLMRRDGMSEESADEAIQEAKDALVEYLDMDEMELAQEVCAEFFSLEPDYLMELMPL